jgi:glutamate dehydrogenase/leucine dehydrogenase
MDMMEQLKAFEHKKPEIVFQWKDADTEAEGWVVINSLRGGAAGGGTRMRVGLDQREVESLAKTMEIKFTVAGPAIGGAKSGINFDPSDPRKEGVLKRWFAAVAPLLKSYYGTGGDLNVDEVHEVIPFTEDNGVWHPQEGVFNGHFKPNNSQKISCIQQLKTGVSKAIESPTYSPDPARKFLVADMITGFGVCASINAYYQLWGGSLKGKKVIIQGWGNVGAAAAYYLSQEGAKIVGIIDRAGGIIKEDGLDYTAIKQLFLAKKGNQLIGDNLLSFDEVNERIWDIEAEVFVPCAGSRLIQAEQLARLLSAGVTVISSGANVPFADQEIFFGPIAQEADRRLSLIPDFIANCGMARVFAFLMEKEHDVLTDDMIFSDTEQVIKNALAAVHALDHSPFKIAERAFAMALDKLSP